MNNCIITAQIATWPRIHKSSQETEVIAFFIRIANPKRGKPYGYIRVKIKDRAGKNPWPLFHKGDYLIFEGSTTIGRLKSSIDLNLIKEHLIILQF